MTVKPIPTNRRDLAAWLAELADRGHLTERDESLFDHLAEFDGLSLDQIHRLLWSEAERVTTYQRLGWLVRSGLVRIISVPVEALVARGLAPGLVYGLGPGGQLWRRPQAPLKWHQPLQVSALLQRLQMAEFYVRLAEAIKQRGADWSLRWIGPTELRPPKSKKRQPRISADGLGILWAGTSDEGAGRGFFVYGSGLRPTPPSKLGWQELVERYERIVQGAWQKNLHLRPLRQFPAVVIVLPTEWQALNLAQFIAKTRQQPVAYYLAVWPDILTGSDLLAQPIWLSLTQKGEVLGQTLAERRSLVSLLADSASL